MKIPRERAGKRVKEEWRVTVYKQNKGYAAVYTSVEKLSMYKRPDTIFEITGMVETDHDWLTLLERARTEARERGIRFVAYLDEEEL